jgi:heme/copper-type cytochrome/quinol oxidase subunit 2
MIILLITIVIIIIAGLITYSYYSYVHMGTHKEMAELECRIKKLKILKVTANDLMNKMNKKCGKWRRWLSFKYSYFYSLNDPNYDNNKIHASIFMIDGVIYVLKNSIEFFKFNRFLKKHWHQLPEID